MSPINIISKPLVCAADSPSSRRSIQQGVALGGRYAVHIRKGLEFGKVISAQMVSSFDNSNSGRCLQSMLFRKYKITPPLDFSCVPDRSFLMWSKPFIYNWLLEILLFKNVQVHQVHFHRPLICAIHQVLAINDVCLNKAYADPLI